MERHKAFATAGAVSVTALAAVVALGANVGLFGLTGPNDGPGRFKLVDSAQQSPAPVVRTEIVDVPVPISPPAGASSRSSAPAAGPSLSHPPAASSGESQVPHGEREAADREDD